MVTLGPPDIAGIRHQVNRVQFVSLPEGSGQGHHQAVAVSHIPADRLLCPAASGCLLVQVRHGPADPLVLDREGGKYHEKGLLRKRPKPFRPIRSPFRVLLGMQERTREKQAEDQQDCRDRSTFIGILG